MQSFVDLCQRSDYRQRIYFSRHFKCVMIHYGIQQLHRSFVAVDEDQGYILLSCSVMCQNAPAFYVLIFYLFLREYDRPILNTI